MTRERACLEHAFAVVKRRRGVSKLRHKRRSKKRDTGHLWRCVWLAPDDAQPLRWISASDRAGTVAAATTRHQDGQRARNQLAARTADGPFSA